MKVYVISLETAIDRRQQLALQLEKLKIDFTFVNAMEPSENEELINAVTDNYRARKLIGREISKREVACALSHKDVGQRLLESDDEICLVLEDDAEVEKEIIDLLRYFESSIKDFDVILLGYCKLLKEAYPKFYRREPLYRIAHSVGRYRFGKVGKNWSSGSVGYFLTRSGAKKIDFFFKKIYTPFDQWNVLERDYGLKILHCRPLIIHEQFQKWGSLIEAERAKEIKNQKKRNFIFMDYFFIIIKICLVEVKLYYPLCRIYLHFTKND